MAKHATALGEASYDHDEFGNRWWLERAKDGPHRRAYQQIAQSVVDQIGKRTAKPVIIDYACGPGLLMARIAKLLPQATIIGLDESQGMLDAARAYLGQELGAERALQVRLVRTALPDFGLELQKAELAVFSFPDFRCDLDGKVIRKLAKQHPEDWTWSKRVGKHIRRHARGLEDCDYDADVFDGDRLFYERLATRNLHRLVKPGGKILRVDYAPGTIDQWQDPYVERHDWSLGSWLPAELEVGKRLRRELLFTRRVAVTYHRSRVIRDVHAQNGDQDCLSGGFSISIMKSQS